MVFSEFRRKFDVLAPHLTKKLGRNYIVKDERRVSGLRTDGARTPIMGSSGRERTHTRAHAHAHAHTPLSKT